MGKEDCVCVGVGGGGGVNDSGAGCCALVIPSLALLFRPTAIQYST